MPDSKRPTCFSDPANPEEILFILFWDFVTRYRSESEAAAHAALVAGFAFFDGAVLGRGEFQQVAELGGLICQKAGCLGDVEFLLAGMRFVTDSSPWREVFRWRWLAAVRPSGDASIVQSLAHGFTNLSSQIGFVHANFPNYDFRQNPRHQQWRNQWRLRLRRLKRSKLTSLPERR